MIKFDLLKEVMNDFEFNLVLKQTKNFKNTFLVKEKCF